MDAELFLSNFAIAKIVRYVAICKKNPKAIKITNERLSATLY